MTIVLTSDNNFVQHCSVTMVSILKNNINVEFYLVTNDLSENNKILLKKIVEENHSKLTIIDVDESEYRDFPMPKLDDLSHISMATYFRLFISKLLPDSINKVVYLDCDTVVRGSIEELWNIDISEYALAAVFQNNEWGIHNKSFERLEIPPDFGYFNAGLMLINLDYWRKCNAINMFRLYIEKKSESILFHDQDVLNAVFYDKVLPLSIKWNFMPIFFDVNFRNLQFPIGIKYHEEINLIEHNPIIIHYVYRPKPWEYGCTHFFRDDYFFYLSFTPWKNWEPNFSLSNYYKYRIAPLIHPLIKRMLILFGLLDFINTLLGKKSDGR